MLYHQSYYHQFYHSQELHCLIREKTLKQRTQKIGKFVERTRVYSRFNLHDTVTLFKLDIVLPKYVLDTLALGPKNPVLEKSDLKVMLAEINLLLNHVQEQNVLNETINDINIATIKYINKCSK